MEDAWALLRAERGQAQQQQSAARQREAALFTHLAQPEETPDDNRPDGQVGLAVWA
jgi:hypothetical protein